MSLRPSRPPSPLLRPLTTSEPQRQATEISQAPTSPILSTPNPGERLASFFDNFFRTIVGISTLGASLTFSKIISSPTEPWIDYGISAETVQFYLSISWLLFALALVITSALASLMSLYKPQAIEALGTKIHKWKKRVMWAATLTSLVLVGLVLASFVFLSLVVVAYCGAVGWTALGLTIASGCVAIFGIAWQSPLEWPQWIIPKSKNDPTRVDSLPRPVGGGGEVLVGTGGGGMGMDGGKGGGTRKGEYAGNYGEDPFWRHMRLQGSLRHKRSFGDLHMTVTPAMDKEYEEYGGAGFAENEGGLRTSGGYVDDSYLREAPQPKKESRHERRERYSAGDHYTQYNRENRNSGASTLVTPSSYEENKRWSNTIPPVRYGGQRPYAQAAFWPDWNP